METPERPESLPPLTFVMPVLNERDYVERAIKSIQAQRYPSETEIVVVLGPSTDGTDAIVHELAAGNPRLRTVRIDRASIPAALNAGLAARRHPVVARVDAHVELPEEYAEPAVRALVEHGAANVGGIMVAAGRTPFQRAVAAAYNSRWGLGGGAYHLRDSPAGEGESTYLGVMKADLVEAVGGYDESFDRGEDWELNRRLREAGHRVWIEPTLHVTYYPRANVVSLAQQFWATGAWRAELVRRFPSANSRRYFAPPLLVTALAASVLLRIPRALGLRSPLLAGLARITSAVPVAHAAVVGAVAVRETERSSDAGRLAAVLAVMHYAWGAGFLARFVLRRGQVVDRSRVRRADDATRSGRPTRSGAGSARRR